MATAIQTRTRLNKSTRPEQKASNSAYRAQLNAKFSFNQLAKAFGANHVVRELVLLMAVTSPAIPHWLVGDTPSRRQINWSLRFERRRRSAPRKVLLHSGKLICFPESADSFFEKEPTKYRSPDVGGWCRYEAFHARPLASASRLAQA